jgi:hypothetical protein
MNKKEMTEHQIQAAVFEWVRVKANSDDRYKMIYAVPNGARTSIGVAMKLKAEGLTKGVFDIVVDVPIMPFHGLRIEVKKPQGVVSPEQKERKKLYEKYGYLARVCRGIDEIMTVIETYFEGKWKNAK